MTHTETTTAKNERRHHYFLRTLAVVVAVAAALAMAFAGDALAKKRPPAPAQGPTIAFTSNRDGNGEILVGGVVGGADDVAEPARQGEEGAPPEGDQSEGTTTQQEQQGSEADTTGTQQVEGDEPAVEEEAREPTQSDGTGDTETVETCDGESMELKAEEERALELHNEAREHHGLEPLCADPQLTRVARSHSEDMIQKRYFSHASPSGETLVARLERSGYEYRTAGENIAWGTGLHAAPEDTFERWMGSPGHRRNVLDGGFEEVGVGAATGDLGGADGHATMYTVDFGTPADAKRTEASPTRAKEVRAAAEEIEGG